MFILLKNRIVITKVKWSYNSDLNQLFDTLCFIFLSFQIFLNFSYIIPQITLYTLNFQNT